MRLFPLFLVLLFPLLALAQPETPEESVSLMVEAFGSQSWPIFMGALITLLVQLVDKVFKMKTWLSKKYIPWFCVVTGMGTSIGASLLAGGAPWPVLLVQGFLSGATAVGLWEMQKVRKKDPA